MFLSDVNMFCLVVSKKEGRLKKKKNTSYLNKIVVKTGRTACILLQWHKYEI